jgi:predicted  nucleic acid-binding Zn-ribbon protein
LRIDTNHTAELDLSKLLNISPRDADFSPRFRSVLAYLGAVRKEHEHSNNAMADNLERANSTARQALEEVDRLRGEVAQLRQQLEQTQMQHQQHIEQLGKDLWQRFDRELEAIQQRHHDDIRHFLTDQQSM